MICTHDDDDDDVCNYVGMRVCICNHRGTLQCLRWQTISMRMPNDETKTRSAPRTVQWDAKSYNASFSSGPRPSPGPLCPSHLKAPCPPTVAPPPAAQWSCGDGGSRGGSVRATYSRVRSAPLAPAPRPPGSPSRCTEHNTNTEAEEKEAGRGSSRYMTETERGLGCFFTRDATCLVPPHAKGKPRKGEW